MQHSAGYEILPVAEQYHQYQGEANKGGKIKSQSIVNST